MTYDNKDEERRDRICRLGEEAFERLRNKDQEDWNSYMAMGDAFQCGREEARAQSGANSINDPRFKKAFSAWLARYPKLAQFDRSDRAKLFTVMENRGEIESWRSTLTWTARSKMNHPTTVLNKWKKLTQVPVEGEPKPSPLANLKQENAELKRQVAHAEERLAATDSGSLFDLKKDRVEHIATTIVGNISAHKVRQIVAAIGKLLDRSTPAG